MYIRVKYKLITAHNLIAYAHRFGFPEVTRARVRQSVIHAAGIEIMNLFFKFRLIIILITSLVLSVDSKAALYSFQYGLVTGNVNVFAGLLNVCQI